MLADSITAPEGSARKGLTESFLDRLGVDYTLADIPVDRVDEKLSRGNQVRVTAIDLDTVERYQYFYENGEALPRVIAHQRSASSPDWYVLDGGNHRHEAAKRAGLKTIPACIISVDHRQADMVRALDNQSHGLPSTRQERLDHAVRLVVNGMDRTAAARFLGFSPSTVSTELRHREVKNRAASLGLSRPASHLAPTALITIGTIEDDKVFADTLTLVNAHGLKMDDVRHLVRTIKSGDAVNLSHYSPPARANGKEATKSHGMRATKQLALAAKSALSLTEDAVVSDLVLVPDEEREEIAKLARRAATRFNLFADVCE